MNFLDVAQSVAEVLREPSLLPTSIGVFGTWGVGKSSLLKMIEAELTASGEDSAFLVVHFDAWLYQGFDGARIALMDRVISAVDDAVQQDKTLLDRAKDMTAKLMGRVRSFRGAAALADLGAMAYGAYPIPLLSIGAAATPEDTPQTTDTSDEIRAYTKTHAGAFADTGGSPEKAIHEFRRDLEETLETIDRTVIVFVDNLDRCLPDVAIETLEAIRLLLFLKRTAFVVAADEEVIRQQLRRGRLMNLDERHVTDYLDKLIQVAVRVPVLGVQEVRAYLYLLTLRRMTSSLNDIDAATDAIRSKLRKAWLGEQVEPDDLLNAIEGDHPDLPARLQAATRMASLLVDPPVGGNPRLIKRLMNTVRLRARVGDRQGLRVAEEALTKVAIFQRCTSFEAFAELARLAVAAPDGKVHLLRSLEEGEEPDEWPTSLRDHQAFIKTWASIEPHLGNVDLRPAIAVSRESLQSVGRESALPPEVLDLLTALRKTKRATSMTLRKRVEEADPVHRTVIMQELVSTLRLKTDEEWKSRVSEALGAVIVAELDEQAATAFVTFLSDRRPESFGRWFRGVHLSKSDWASPYRSQWGLDEPTTKRKGK